MLHSFVGVTGTDGNPYHNIDTECVVTASHSPSFSPDGAYLSVLVRETIMVWRTGIASLAGSFKPTHKPIWNRFLPDSRQIVCGSVGHNIAIWELPSGRLVQEASLEAPAATGALQYAADTGFSMLGTISSDGVLRLWDTEGWQQRQSYTFPPSRAVLQLAASTSASHPRTHVAAVIHIDESVSILQICPTSFQCHSLKLTTVPSNIALSSNGNHLAVGTSAFLSLYSTEDCSCLWTSHYLADCQATTLQTARRLPSRLMVSTPC